MPAMRVVFQHFTNAGEMCAKLCAAIALFGIMALMVCDVFGRYLLNHPIPGAAEIIQLAMGIIVFAALPLVTARREHIMLDYFDSVLAGNAKRFIRTIIDLITATILTFLAWRIALKAMTHIQYGDTTAYLNIPIAPVAIFIAAATAVSAVALMVGAICSLTSGTHQPETNP